MTVREIVELTAETAAFGLVVCSLGAIVIIYLLLTGNLP